MNGWPYSLSTAHNAIPKGDYIAGQQQNNHVKHVEYSPLALAVWSKLNRILRIHSIVNAADMSGESLSFSTDQLERYMPIR